MSCIKNTFSVHANSEEVEAYAIIHRLMYQISVFKKKKSSQLVKALHSLFVKSKQHLDVTSVAV